MEICVKPWNLKVNITSVKCQCCGDKLKRSIDKCLVTIRECSNCHRSMRPFNGYCGPCYCTTGHRNCINMSCERCISPKCTDCNILISCNETNCSIERRCYDCNKKYKFKILWSGSPEQKLKSYGIIKLKILAKNKNIKKYSKFTKQQLYDLLLPLVCDNDFPIKLKI